MGAQTNNAFSASTAGSGGDQSGVPGVTQTNGKGESIPQIDPQQAMAYYAQAGQEESAGIAAGNTAYQAALKNAGQEITEGYQQANQTLAPLSQASNQALTIMQQMMGITPVSPTANYGTQLLQIDPKLTSIADMINQANSATDATSRAALQQQINTQLQAAGTSGVTAAQAALTSLGSAPPQQITINNDGNGKYTVNDPMDPGIPSNSKSWTPQNLADLQADQAKQQQALTTYNQNQPLDQSALTAAQTQQQNLNSFNQSFNTNFAATPAQGYNAQQVAQKIEATPGYQFQLDQGNQQILRNQAAIGNLGTGNTQVALQNYGQNYAQNAYNGYMNNLSGIVNAGVGATTQTAANQANQGGYLSNIQQLGGQASDQALAAEGQAIGNASNLQGSTAYNAAALNTQNQMTAYLANQQASQQAQSSASNLAANLSGQSNQTNSANASGAGFYQGMNSVVNDAEAAGAASGWAVPQSNGGAA